MSLARSSVSSLCALGFVSSRIGDSQPRSLQFPVSYNYFLRCIKHTMRGTHLCFLMKSFLMSRSETPGVSTVETMGDWYLLFLVFFVFFVFFHCHDHHRHDPPCRESQGFQFDPTFLWSSVVLLPSPIAFSVILFLSPPIHLPFISLNLVFSKDRLFRLALVLLFLVLKRQTETINGISIS